MVNEPVRPLLAMALQKLDKAKRLFVYRLVAHFLALGFTLLAAYILSEHPDAVETSIELSAASAAILFELAAFIFHHKAVHLHTAGRMAMRRVMLLDALSPDAALPTLEHHFDKNDQALATALVLKDKESASCSILPTYYWSPKPPGQPRLRDHLYESALFSNHLYIAAWQVSLVCLIGMLLFGIPVMFVAVWGGTHAESARLARMMIAVVAFLPACQELEHMFLYRMVGHELGQLFKRVEALYADPLQGDQPSYRLFAEFGDYCAATTFAPPIRNLVYKYLGPNIAAKHLQKMRELGQL